MAARPTPTHPQRVEVALPHTIDIHFHQHGRPADSPHGATLEQLAPLFKRLEKILMGMKEDYEAGFAEIDAATTSIAERIQDFLDAQAAGGMTVEEEAANLTKLQTVVASLKAMGKTPTDPVPVPVP